MTEATKRGAQAQSRAEAESASAHSRINIPLNLQNWKHLPVKIQGDLLWYHQHLLDQQIGWKDAEDTIGYDRSTIFKVLKGTYGGSWSKISKAIRSYKRVADRRGTIQQNELVANSITNMVCAGLDYALANNSITTITGESRMGKSVAAQLWRRDNNHGTSVYVVAPPYGGTKMFLRRVAEAQGVNKNMSAPQMYEAIVRGYNKHRILLVDEAHRLLPGDRRTNPTCVEICRDLHDSTGCALAFIATQRFDDELRKAHYQFEQVLGRIGMPIRLPRKIKAADFTPIVRQYVRRPSPKMMAECKAIANSIGRLGILVETLKAGSRVAAKAKRQMTEKDFFTALAIRRQMMGEREYAKK